ncbi:MAG: hypothetical protein LBN36_06240 [Clostridiales Family XIII bacterium]|nr:hypothetical protein [Clostridiales Family XIII bacterium]
MESLILGQYGDAAFNNYGINWHRISPIGANNPNISETDSQTQQEVLSSGIPIDIDITPSSLQWIITPYVFLDEEKLNHIREKLEENAVDLAEIASSVLPEFWKEHKKQIRTAFDSLKMNLNLTSMVVYSGPKKVTPKEWIWSKDLGKSYIEGEVGCLYTGDICLKSEVQFEKLKTELGDLWSTIGVIQMPHHGSSYSYNNKLSREDWQFVISAGTTNRYRHPSHKVIADLLSKENCVRIVTEHKGSELLYLITTLADHTEDAL